MPLVIPTYFSPISQYSVLWDADNIVFEVEDNYQKQSYRNRCYIAGPNGKQLLSIPVSFPSSTDRKKTKDAKIDYSESWQKQHLKSFEAAYNASPFFDLLRHEIVTLFSKNHTYLLDLNIDTFLFVKDTLELKTSYSITDQFYKEQKEDYRFLASSKTAIKFDQKEYTQVFSDKHGFIHNTSILDLLFMEGANTISYLEKNRLLLESP